MTRAALAAAPAAIILGTAILLAHVSGLVAENDFRAWDGKLQDTLFRLRTAWSSPAMPHTRHVLYADGAESVSPGVVDPEAVADPDAIGRLMRGLGELGPAAQVYDYVLTRPLAPTDLEVLATTTPDLIVGCIAGIDSPGARQLRSAWQLAVEGDPGDIPTAGSGVASHEGILAVAKGQGFLDLRPSADGVVRRVPLLARTYQGYIPSLSLLAVCSYLDVSPQQLLVRPGHSILLRGARWPNGDRADHSIPVDSRCFALVDWRKPWKEQAFVPSARIRLAARDAAEAALLRRHVSERVVFLGDFGLDGNDVFATPLEAVRPGIGVHGEVFESLLSSRPLRDAPPFATLLGELAMAVALFFAARREKTGQFLVGAAAIGGIALAAALALFGWANVLPPLLAPLIFFFASLVGLAILRIFASEVRRAELRGAFEAYFPPPLVQQLVEDPTRILRAGARKDLTILFSDIVGFSSRAEAMEAGAVQTMLNIYFELMVDSVFAHGGTLDKFIGDGLMVFFGDPVTQSDHAERAVRCAIDMQQKLRRLAHDARIQPPLHARIGISTGSVVVGNLGSRRRLAYTTIGSVVNLAARLESAAPPDGILASEATWNALAGKVRGTRIGPLKLKNIAPIYAYDILID